MCFRVLCEGEVSFYLKCWLQRSATGSLRGVRTTGSPPHLVLLGRAGTRATPVFSVQSKTEASFICYSLYLQFSFSRSASLFFSFPSALLWTFLFSCFSRVSWWFTLLIDLFSIFSIRFYHLSSSDAPHSLDVCFGYVWSPASTF